MKNKFLYILIAVLFIGSYFLGGFLSQSNIHLDKKALDYHACDPSYAPCSAALKGHNIELVFLQQPSSLESFEVLVKIDGVNVDQVSLNFYMKDMDMGINKYNLIPGENNMWTTQAMLPICSLARNDWVAELQVIKGNQIWFAEYNFEQIKR